MQQYTVITKDGSKWLRPINVPYPNADDYEDGNEPHPELARADAVIYEEGTRPVPYIGSHPEGTVVDESEVREVRQHRHKDDPKDAFFTLNDNTLWLWENRSDHRDIEFRTAYTDAESHDRHIRPFKTHNVRPLVNQLVGEEISFSRFIELLNEIANGN